MKKIALILVFFILNTSLYAQRIKFTTWEDTMTDRSIEYLFNKYKQSNKDFIEWMKEHVLLSHACRVIDNPYFDKDATEIVNKHYYLNEFLDRDNLKKAFSYLKTDEILFWKVDSYKINKNLYIIIYETVASKNSTSNKKIGIKKYATIAIFKYKFNDKKGTYDIETIEEGDPR